MELFITVFTIMVTASICVLVLMRTKKDTIKWAFAAMCAWIVLWITSNYVVNNLDSDIVMVNIFHRLAYLSGYMTVLSGLIFSYHFPHRRQVPRVERLILSLVACSMVVFSILSNVVGEVVYQAGEIIYTTGPLMMLYVAGFAATLVILARNLTLHRYRLRTHNIQARFIRAAFVISALAGLTLNVLLPMMTNDWSWTYYGPLAVLILVAMVSYTIIRHQLFDIRLAAVRTVGYVLTLGVFAGLYFLLAYAISSWFFQGDSDDNPINISFINMLIAITLAFLFQPIKEFFDRLTGRVFFHNRYDPAEFISGLGDILTSTTNLHSLLSKSLDHITVTLKSSYAAFVVINEGKAPTIVSSNGRKQFSEKDLDALDHLCKTARHRMVFANEVPEDRPAIYRVFSKHKIAIVIPLAHAKSTVGYLVIGEHKSSGYNKRDISMLESVTNELVIAIQNARSLQALRDFNVHLQQSIETATKELRQSNNKLRRIDEAKDEFVSMASHQLRTPLTSIKGYISMVLDGDVGKVTPQQHKLLNEAFVSSERMVRLIGDFLNVSRIQTGKFMIDAKVVDIKAVVAEEVETLQQMATSHGMKLQYIAPEIVPDISIDEDKTRQVIMNFIDNAIYYSPEGTTITVKLKVDSKHVSLEVHDKGIGVPKDKQAQLFTKFFRADNARKQRPDGTGVGLYLAKKVIEEQGGEIIFHSHVGLGSVFGFKLPVKRQ